MWNYKEIGNEMVAKMLLVNGICEPTLAQIQEKSEESVHGDENSKNTPAWLYYSSLANEHEIKHKIVIKLINNDAKSKKKKKNLPSLSRLKNGLIVITGRELTRDMKQKIEIFLQFHDNLIPCCYTTSFESITTESPSTVGQIRCFYIAVEHAIKKATFLTSNADVIHRCDYKEIWFHGSTSYQQLLFTTVTK